MKTIQVAMLAMIFMIFSCAEKKKENENAAKNVSKTIAENVEKETVNGYQVGDIIKDFSLKNVDGQMVSLANYSDAKGFIITFTCNTCPYSVAYEDRLIALDKKYGIKTVKSPIMLVHSSIHNRGIQEYEEILMNLSDQELEINKEEVYKYYFMKHNSKIMIIHK